MTGALRPTGLDVVGDMPWGTHFCLFYETKEDLLSILLPYFRAGLEAGEHCLWVLSKSEPITKAEAWNSLRRVVDLKQTALAESIELLSHDEWFYEGDRFNIDKAIGRIHEKLHRALTAGKAGIRFNGGSAWLLVGRRQQSQLKSFHAYERALDQALVDRSIIALCNFPGWTATAAEMLDATHTHHFGIALRKGSWQTVQTVAPTKPHKLTPREAEVLTWVAKGKTALQIAEILRITKRTVDEHTQKAAAKLGAANRTQAVALALLARIIEV